ncbi:hypothetical protein [Burkholderia sp. SCN-KJ]|uniref:hypothetical protein n=1 Tax=Burkholderia sp. SCN-KJ TaxID=2969248 RepID=UPI00215014A2|nr:hypothetical protein [Burkholderia sp. SCN-KJ]MCR4471335.1 hypothetical protein [Burkholderia sp. SCN-KJ]
MAGSILPEIRAVVSDENRLPVSKDIDFFDERIGGAAEIVAAFAHQSEMRTVRVDAGRPHYACSAWTTQCQALDGANRRIVLLPWLRVDMSIAGQ